MIGPVCQIGNADQVDQMIARAAALGLPGQAELLRSVRRSETNLVQLGRSASAPTNLLERALRTVIALLGGDDYHSTGPTGWTSVHRLLNWARGAMVHATGGDAASYHVAIGMALTCRRFLLIETDTAHGRDWGEALLKRRIPFLCLRPPDGSDPVMPDVGAMH